LLLFVALVLILLVENAIFSISLSLHEMKTFENGKTFQNFSNRERERTQKHLHFKEEEEEEDALLK